MLVTFHVESISLGIKRKSFGEAIIIGKSPITNSQTFTRQRKYILYYFYYVIHYLFHCLFVYFIVCFLNVRDLTLTSVNTLLCQN